MVLTYNRNNKLLNYNKLNRIIILVGLLGCGKTTVGLNLAKKLGYNFIDLDQYIENKTKSTIIDIFNLHGEQYFRDIETESLQHILNQYGNKDYVNLVLSLGGGAFVSSKNIGLCQKYQTIWLNTSLDIIATRLALNTKVIHPLLQNKDTAEELKHLLKKRIGFYSQAKLKIDINTSISTSNIVDQIINIL